MAGIAGVTRKGGRVHYLSTIARDTVTRWDWLPDLEVHVGGTTSVDVTEPGTSMTGQQSDERPWGSYVVLGGGDGYQVKKIVVKSERRLSYQRHLIAPSPGRRPRLNIVSTVEGEAPGNFR